MRDRRAGRRWAVIVGGAIAGIGACVLAAFVILSGVGASGEKGSGQVVGSGASESSPTAKGERAAVPDSCTIVGDDLINKLAPDSERNVADNYQGDDQQNQCVWGAYAGDRKRQLTIELRAIARRCRPDPDGRGPQDVHHRADRRRVRQGAAGRQELKDKIRLEGVGDEGYIVYSVDDKQGSGEAVGNVRLGNVLVTIHYSGSNKGDPLASRDATGGATEVAKAVVTALNQG
ncbi:hypothetical protein LUX57_35450 [Actinomadura madurae]|uniref:hypothetical protein n=1 Tax=Actinomadura madurae TaxID=1993 RepID=UPI0020D2353E|nr:hypothetical protein [Actinomadura madurae]MCP9969835.1 hypothetical protein [Actinomadura madurae]